MLSGGFFRLRCLLHTLDKQIRPVGLFDLELIDEDPCSHEHHHKGNRL